MGNKTEKCQALGVGPRGYLYFGNKLYVGSTPGEEHEQILASSGEPEEHVLVAGGLLVDGNRIVVDGRGSSSLGIGPRDSTPVAVFIRAFPDAGGYSITPTKG